MTAPLDGVAPLSHLGVIRAEGEEAAKFLHAQLSNDFSLLGLDQARLAAFCTAKGRMLASFIGFKRSPAEILLVCSADLLPQTLKRLSMFVLRAKVKLSDASADTALYGLAGEALAKLAAPARPPWAKVDVGSATLVHLYPADGVARGLWVAPRPQPAPDGAALAPDTWLWSEVRSGVATVSAPIAEAFVPQMLNYESVGGVNFKKGCYPGQEVVARSQFRGTLKRRAFIVESGQPLRAGDEVFHSSDPQQPAGTVAQAAAGPSGTWGAIVSMQVNASADGQLTAGGPEGPALVLQPLPYRLLDDI